MRPTSRKLSRKETNRMKVSFKGARRGFSLVELLAVVLILAVLAAVAVPLYINTRRASAARACKGNIASIASALSTFGLRNGQYPAAANVMSAYVPNAPTTGGLVGAPEGLAASVTCPLDGSAYTFAGGGAGASITISCPHNTAGDKAHPNVVPSNSQPDDWTRTLAAPAQD